MVLHVHANTCDSPPNICNASRSLVCMNWKVGGTRWRRTQRWKALKDARFDQWYILDAKHTILHTCVCIHTPLPPYLHWYLQVPNAFKQTMAWLLWLQCLHFFLNRNLALISKPIILMIFSSFGFTFIRKPGGEKKESNIEMWCRGTEPIAWLVSSLVLRAMMFRWDLWINCHAMCN